MGASRDPDSPSRKKRERQRRRENASEIIRENVTAARNGWREAEEVAAGLSKLDKEEHSGQADSRQVTRERDRVRAKLEGRRLRLMERDDDYILELLGKPHSVEGACPLEGTTDADEFLHLLIDQLDILPALAALKPAATRLNEETGKEVHRRFMFSSEVLNLLSVIVRFLGLSSGPEVQSIVLTDVRWMARLGFTLQEVEQGSNRRSVGLTGKTREGASGRFEDAGEVGPARNRDDLQVKRGALSSQTLAGHEEALAVRELAELFNEAVRKVAAAGHLPKRIDGSLDTSNLEVSPEFEGAGVTRRKVKAKSKNRRPRQVETTIRGFKVWVLIDTATGIPLGMTVSTIETGDIVLAREVVEQSMANIEGSAELAGLAVDRGFLDGDFLYWLKEEKGVVWTCPSKEKMLVTDEARSRVETVLAKESKPKPDGMPEDALVTAMHLARRYQAIEGVSFHEHDLGRNREPLVTATVSDLYETDFYGPGGSDSSRVHSKNFRPTPLHATVVLNWPDRLSEDAEDNDDDGDAGRGPVVLLSPVPEPGRQRYDRYDRRSLIENQTNRDGKQHFSLGAPLARNESAMQSGVYFSVLALLLWRVLLVLQEEAETTDRRAERLGIVRYRRKLLVENRGKVMVWTDGFFGILDMNEMMAILGVLKT